MHKTIPITNANFYTPISEPVLQCHFVNFVGKDSNKLFHLTNHRCEGHCFAKTITYTRLRNVVQNQLRIFPDIYDYRFLRLDSLPGRFFKNSAFYSYSYFLRMASENKN